MVIHLLRHLSSVVWPLAMFMSWVPQRPVTRYTDHAAINSMKIPNRQTYASQSLVWPSSQMNPSSFLKHFTGLCDLYLTN